MLKYPCLVLDHDDTTVNSTATVHYPCFVEYMEKYFPHVHLCGMTWDQMLDEEKYWDEYVKHHVPKAYEGIREIMEKQKERGGKVCVISHSFRENILRDYRENGLPEPDLIFGWECPPEKRKPAVWPLEQIMKEWNFRPEELLVVDDLKPGYDMAQAAGVPFAAAGWANDIPEIEQFMRKNCGLYFKTVRELRDFLFGNQ